MAKTYAELRRDPSFPNWGAKIVVELELGRHDPVDVVNVLEAILEAAKVRLTSIQRTREVRQGDARDTYRHVN